MGIFGTLATMSRPVLTSCRLAQRVVASTPFRLHQPTAQQTVFVFQCSSVSTLCRNCCILPLFRAHFHRQLQKSVPLLNRSRLQLGYSVLGAGDGMWVGGVGGVRGVMSGGRGRPDTYHRRTGMIYLCAAGVFMLGMAYAGVPLYRMFCQATGFGGTVSVSRGHDTSKVESMQPVAEREIIVRFNADVASSMRWNFKPQQTEVKVLPGETALAFYTAKNPTDKPIIGISTYNVVPFEAGQYFNKIQCFCFEEQRLNPHEQVDMPVFFYIDPEFAEDPKLDGITSITLSYTFFEAKEGFQVPLPGYMQPQTQ